MDDRLIGVDVGGTKVSVAVLERWAGTETDRDSEPPSSHIPASAA